MKTRTPRQRSDASYALLLALVFVGVSLLLLASLLQWTSGNTFVTDRNNAYNRAVGAAEAATEMVLSRVGRDFRNQSFDPGNVSVYRSLIPTNDWTAEYEFSDGAGTVGQTWVDCSPAVAVPTNLDSAFGLYGSNYLCRVRSNVRLPSTVYRDFALGVRQDFQLASIPIFQFAVFYAMDLEINPQYEMIVKGKVHGNADIYASPDYRLEFTDAVEAVGRIYHHRHPSDPNFSSGNLPVYDSLHKERVGSLTLPIGTDHSPADVRSALLDPRPPGEDPASLVGKQRYCNKANVIVTTTDNSWMATFNGVPLTFSNVWTGTNFTFLTTNTFWDYRERKPILSVDMNVGNFFQWMANNSSWQPPQPICMYVNDQCGESGGGLAAVRVTNGKTLSSPLTIATARPLYVMGDFNAPNFGSPRPASLVGDSITILSAHWDDDVYVSQTTLLDRDAQVSITVNAAILAGIVPTTNVGGTQYYSGGVGNFLRLLENWSVGINPTFTFNGSMAALFPSRYATNFWKPPGVYYNPPDPSRYNWTFDVNLLDWNGLPPGTPQVLKLVRGRWQVIASGSPN